MPVERVDQLAQGRVWTGAQARERGLVDALGGLDRAIALAKERAGIAADTEVDGRDLPGEEDTRRVADRTVERIGKRRTD
jgi:protease-4